MREKRKKRNFKSGSFCLTSQTTCGDGHKICELDSGNTIIQPNIESYKIILLVIKYHSQLIHPLNV